MQRVTSSNWPHLAWAMFLAGLLIRSQPEMGMEKYAWKTGGNLYYPASTFSPRHYKQGLRNSIISITTRSQIRSSTVMSNYYAVPCSDVIMFWNQYPTVLWHFPATKEWGYDGRVPGTAATCGYEHIPDRIAIASENLPATKERSYDGRVPGTAATCGYEHIPDRTAKASIKELITKVCYQASSPGKEPENSQTFTLNRSAVFFLKGTSCVSQDSYDHAQRSWENSSETSILVLSNPKQPPARAGPRSAKARPLTPGVMNQEGTGPLVPISTQHRADCCLALQRLAHRFHHDAPRPRPCKPRFFYHKAHGPNLRLPLADYRSRRGKATVAGTMTASTRPPGGVSGCISRTSGQERLAQSKSSTGRDSGLRPPREGTTCPGRRRPPARHRGRLRPSQHRQPRIHRPGSVPSLIGAYGHGPRLEDGG